MAQNYKFTFGEVLRFFWSIYGFAVVMAMVAIIPGCNFAYSGHGGPAWFIVPFVFPYALVRMAWIYFSANGSRRKSVSLLVGIALIVYIPLSLIATYIGARSIEASFGLPLKPLELWGMFMMPLGLFWI